MATIGELVRSGALNTPKSSGRRTGYQVASTPILTGKLKQIQRYGTISDVQKARSIAQKGTPSPQAKGLMSALGWVNVLGRGVVATGDELGEALGIARRDEQDWLEKVKDPSYGFGRVIRKNLPDLPGPIASAVGLAGDIAFDPTTYLTFGATPAMRMLGRGEGAARLAFDAADYADELGKMAQVYDRAEDATAAARSAAELRRIGTKAGKLSPLADDELRTLETASQFMAKEGRGVEAGTELGRQLRDLTGSVNPYAGQRAYESGSLGYGVTWQFPGGRPVNLGRRGPQAAVGRALESTGAKITRKALTTDLTAKLTGGQLVQARRMLGSGLVDQAAEGSRIIAAVGRGKAAGGRTIRWISKSADSALATLKNAGVDGTDVMRAMGERPIVRDATKLSEKALAEHMATNPARITGGPAWQELVSRGPEVERALVQLADFYGQVPKVTGALAKVGNVSRQFIHDSTESGRPYVPRVASDEFIDFMGRSGQRLRPRPGQPSWFQKSALTVGDEIGEGEAAWKLVEPGIADERYAGGIAPALEEQVDTGVKQIYGDNAVQWYEGDFYKAHEKYKVGIANQVNEQTVQNYLLSKGISKQTMADAVRHATTSGWREDLFGPFVARAGGRVSYSGKMLNNIEYAKLQRLLDEQHEAITIAQAGWDLTSGEDRLAALHLKVLDAEEGLARLTTGEQSRHYAKRLANLREAEDAYLHAAVLLDESYEAAQIAQLQGAYKETEALLTGHEQAWDQLVNDERFLDGWGNTLFQGNEQYGFGRQASSQAVEALRDISRSYDPINNYTLRKYIKIFDNVNHWMKGWLTATPGFLMRNIFGGMFNNWLAGADVLPSMTRWGMVMRRSTEAGIAAGKQTVADRAVVDIMDRLGVLGQGYYRSELGATQSGRFLDWGKAREWSVNPLAGTRGGSRQFFLPAANRRVNENLVEPLLRGTLAYDRLARAVGEGRFASLGVSSLDDLTDLKIADAFVEQVMASPLADEIIDDVFKYHFDYDDLSFAERQVGRRIFPFYTWTRKNVPLQVEAMFTQPGKALGRYASIKKNIEAMSEGEDVVPGWFSDAGLIRTPFTMPGGRLYASVELPFKDPFKMLDPTGQGAAMLNPMLKAPYEAHAGKQFFGDLPLRDVNQAGGSKEVPTLWYPLMPVMQLAARLPMSPFHAPFKGEGGQWMMGEDDMYLLGQYVPFLQQAQRLLPSQEKYKNRLHSTWASWMIGVNLRTNTPQDQENEMYRRADEADKIVTRLKAQGVIPVQERKPRKGAQESLEALLSNMATSG